MKFSVFFTILLCGLFFTACNQPADTTVSMETLTAIKKLQSDAWEKFNKDHNTQAMVEAIYAEGAHFMAPNAPVVTGKKGIVEVMSSFPPFVMEFDITNAEGSGDLVVITPMYKMSSSDGMALDEGKSIEIWKKQADGSWKIVYDIFNSNRPMPVLAHDQEEADE